ncbi:MAG: hypothetical protein A2785_03210 [Candidatus Chisholmbacteria bacterium RIFCSPHIGHO2_01_FULL_49_18]|uniref:Nitroreductase domain-containing protein n=1 Tax=Candidatus Chisholmbacteria bacterium RIFCSPHIGHO2_01_FULL_49_18 TaxID=1797590 RepID=A0A1G1VMF7_9BACT|nr:MAG: hypothetical protein A2785_03210 [Candidatus Chisholmbacteria bacterium RIFCSPHIGHO2_01_FULL_49_18]
MINKRLLKRFKFFQRTSSQIYREVTKLDEFRKEIPVEKYPLPWTKVYYKGYPKFEKIRLIKPRKLLINEKVFRSRESYRSYSGKSLSLAQLATLLYYTAGLKDNTAQDIGNRFYPSAGGRYPIELYPVIFNVSGLKHGIYHYHLKTNSLEYLWIPRKFPDAFTECFQQKGMVKMSSVLLLFTACFGRTEIKYGPRGYRHIMINVGSMQQNVYLICAYLGIGCCSIGGYLDKKMNALLDVDGLTESTVLAVTIGTKRRAKGGE